MKKKVGLCHVVFDVVHTGHINHFKQAKEKVDYLVVSIADNKFVNKVDGSPYFSSNIPKSEKLANTTLSLPISEKLKKKLNNIYLQDNS